VAVGFWKGWGSVKTIWTYTKKFGWVALILIGLVIAAFASGRKNNKVKEIDQKLAEAQAIENKTAADLQKIQQLHKEREEAEKDIIGIAEKYKQKLKDLDNQKPTPGGAGRSKDDLDKIW
jgi:hypothetical protein